VHLFLVHHGDAVGPDVDPRRPLSARGHASVLRLSAEAAAQGAKPVVVWHSGKLRARQTAEEYWRACNALAEFSATRDLQPDDAPSWIRDRLRGESRDIMLVGHYPHLPALLGLLTSGFADSRAGFPQHGVVALESSDQGESWREIWRLQDA
jgi:phosphohistidine phosphatase